MSGRSSESSWWVDMLQTVAWLLTGVGGDVVSTESRVTSEFTVSFV